MAETLPTEEPKRASLEVDEQLVADIATLIRSDQQAMVMNVVTDLYSADLAVLMRHLAPDERWRLFEWLSTERASEVIPEIDPSIRTDLIERLDQQRDRKSTRLNSSHVANTYPVFCLQTKN